jgi:hypothetical protein
MKEETIIIIKGLRIKGEAGFIAFLRSHRTKVFDF